MKRILFVSGLVVMGCLITFLLTFNYLPTKKVYIENDKSLLLQAQIIDRLTTNLVSPQGLTDLNKLSTYNIWDVADTGSMIPTMNGKSKILVDKEPVTVGDIIVYHNGENMWVHRIIGEDTNYWYCQGDANKYDNQIEDVPKNTEIWRVMGILY
jgi:Peptidase S24-like.